MRRERVALVRELLLVPALRLQWLGLLRPALLPVLVPLVLARVLSVPLERVLQLPEVLAMRVLVPVSRVPRRLPNR